MQWFKQLLNQLLIPNPKKVEEGQKKHETKAITRQNRGQT